MHLEQNFTELVNLHTKGFLYKRDVSGIDNGRHHVLNTYIHSISATHVDTTSNIPPPRIFTNPVHGSDTTSGVTDNKVDYITKFLDKVLHCNLNIDYIVVHVT